MTHLIWSGNLNVPVCIKLWEVCRYQLTTEAEEKCNPWSRSSSMIFRPALSCTSTTRVHIGDNLTVGGPVPHDLTGFGDTSPRRPSGDDSKHPRPSLRPALRPRCPKFRFFNGGEAGTGVLGARGGMKQTFERFLGDVRRGNKPVDGPSAVTALPGPVASAGCEGFWGLANCPSMLTPTIFCTDLTDGDDDVSVTVVIRKLLALFLSLGEEVLRI